MTPPLEADRPTRRNARKGDHRPGFLESKGAVVRVALLIPGLIGLAFVVTAGAAPPPNTPTTAKFDGTYAFVSSTSLNETSKHGRGQCVSSGTISPLTIANGQVRYSASDGVTLTDFEGFVNVQGQFTTRGTNPVSGTAISGYGKINGDGTIYLRWIGWFCDFDLVWKR